MKVGDTVYAHSGVVVAKGSVVDFFKGDKVAVTFSRQDTEHSGVFSIPRALVCMTPEEAQKAHEIWKILES